MGTNPPAEGVRERVRQLTSSELAAAAWRLFASRGYDATTVADIVAEVGISERTYFRYYGSKDEMATKWLDKINQAVVDRLNEQGPAMSPTLALRRSLDVFCEMDSDEWERMILTMTLASASQSLMGALTLSHRRWETAITKVLAERMHATPDDVRPAALMAAGFSILDACLAQMTTRTFHDSAIFARLLDSAFTILTPSQAAVQAPAKKISRRVPGKSAGRTTRSSQQ